MRLTYLQPAVAAGLRALHIKQDAQLYWAPAVAAALLHMTQLTAFALEGPPLSGCVMRALASLPRLQRLVQCGAQFAEGYELAYGTMKDIPAEEKLPTAGSELTWMRVRGEEPRHHAAAGSTPGETEACGQEWRAVAGWQKNHKRQVQQCCSWSSSSHDPANCMDGLHSPRRSACAGWAWTLASCVPTRSC